MDTGLRKKNALVLSSSRGLGLGIAEALADEGANVLLTGRSEERLKENVTRINKKGKGRAEYARIDLNDVESVSVIKKSVKEFLVGPIY